jgi:Asp-tRNA(Asn)/Glu-tRNA(Gln) amidotransferase A subunit family amidase
VVQAYVERAREYNGICTELVTADGAPVKPGPGVVRAGAPITFPEKTVAISAILPGFDEYDGLPIEFGRMEPTQSDPTVEQQYGMVVGMKNAGQVNALATLNLRGERSVTCKAECDLHPKSGALPSFCPAVCEEFRAQPDALERAAELDATYGRNPDLEKLPMYCGVFSFKDVYDAKDMRSTGGADVSYATDFAPEDSTIVSELRAKGAIIYAKANLSEYNGGGGNPGPVKAKTRTYGAGARAGWPGTACNVYDSAFETGGSSSGSAASVGGNLVTCSICEETGGSCRQPAWRNGAVALVTTKGLIPYGGSIGAEPYLDRAGIVCRNVRDTSLVLDALRDPERGYFDPRDIHSALPRALVSDVPYANFTLHDPMAPAAKKGKPLEGVRIGVVREYMVKHAVNDAAVSDYVDEEIKRVLRDELGATLVETTDPEYPDDPTIANAEYTFQDAMAEILPVLLPEYVAQKDKEGALKFAVAGYDVSQRGWAVLAAEGRAPLSPDINLRSVNSSPGTASFGYHMEQYLLRRGDATVKDWASLNANTKNYEETRTIAMLNWQNKTDLLSDGITRRVKMRDAMRLVLMKVMLQNDIDVLVNPTITLPPALIGYASEPSVKDRPNGRFPTSANLGIPEVTVPAGYNMVIYEPKYLLNAKKDNYDEVSNSTEPTMLENPLPIGISFWAGPGDEPVVLRVASTYEEATHHRVAPPALGPVAGHE